MTISVRQPMIETGAAAALKAAMRHLVGGVSVITAGIGEDRTGLTVTSVVSLSMEPPTVMVCVNRSASAWPVIGRHRHFGVNILGAHQQHVAERFTGRNGEKGAERYAGASWRELSTGALGLEEALAVLDCDVDEVLERHSHGIILGSVKAVHFGALSGQDALVYGNGRFSAVGLPA